MYQQENMVLCGSNVYEKKFYLNEEFSALPDMIKDELKVMCVLYTEEIGGILTLEFEEDGLLYFKVASKETDFMFDEIGSALKIKQLQREKEELLQAIEMFYKVFFLGEEVGEEE
jgi:hypothetical protein